MRRYLAYCPDEEPRIFRMLDLISGGAQGQVPFILSFFLLLSWVLLGMGRKRVGLGCLSPSSYDG